MELLGTFETVSEIAVALAGFSGIVTALAHRQGQPWGSVEWFRLKVLLVWSLGVALLALVPAALSALPAVSGPWRVAHGVFAAFHLSSFIWYFTAVRSVESGDRVFPAALNRLTLPIAVAILLAELAVAAGYLAGLGAFLYLVALIWFLFSSAVAFALLLFSGGPSRPGA